MVLENTINLIILLMEYIYSFLTLISAVLLITLRNSDEHKRDIIIFYLLLINGIMLIIWLYANFWWQTLLGCLGIVAFSIWEANHYTHTDNENII